MHLLTLTIEEQSWLETYLKVLNEAFPGLVESIVIFGSKARGDATPDSDLDILIILREGDSVTKRTIRSTGHRLAVMTNVVPSIMIYTREEWAVRERNGSPLHRAVLRDGIAVR